MAQIIPLFCNSVNYVYNFEKLSQVINTADYLSNPILITVFYCRIFLQIITQC